MKKNWMYGSVMTALLALLVSGCGDSQRTLEFRGICVDDLHGEMDSIIPEEDSGWRRRWMCCTRKIVRQRNCWNYRKSM